MEDNFCIGIVKPGNEYPTTRMVEFTEDDWTTVYTGYCVDSTFYSYLVKSPEYGTFWIAKRDVRLK